VDGTHRGSCCSSPFFQLSSCVLASWPLCFVVRNLGVMFCRCDIFYRKILCCVDEEARACGVNEAGAACDEENEECDVNAGARTSKIHSACTERLALCNCSCAQNDLLQGIGGGTTFKSWCSHFFLRFFRRCYALSGKRRSRRQALSSVVRRSL
jgi:hypothetical protein